MTRISQIQINSIFSRTSNIRHVEKCCSFFSTRKPRFREHSVHFERFVARTHAFTEVFSLEYIYDLEQPLVSYIFLRLREIYLSRKSFRKELRSAGNELRELLSYDR